MLKKKTKKTVKTSFYQQEYSECLVVPGCLGPSSGQRDDCVKASECSSDLLYYDILGEKVNY